MQPLRLVARPVKIVDNATGMGAGRNLDEDASGDRHTELLLSSATTAPASAFAIEIIEGADRGRMFRLDATEPLRALVGQGPACELRLADGLVSRRHAALEVSGNELRIRDERSRNGTFVNGVRILEAFLSGGEAVTVGATTLRVSPESDCTAKHPLSASTSFGSTIGASLVMRRLYPLCERLARSDLTIVIEGETGAGKEVLAESIHEASHRAAGPFVVFDCTAIAPTLLESELFGHERGAFTGATAGRRGMVEQARGGTLLIDEIGDLPLALQAKLLRLVERKEVRRIGGEGYSAVDVRIIAATRRDLDREVQEGRFRDDLYHRLAMGRIELPPLRDRVGDVLLLVDGFCRDLGADPGAVPPEILGAWSASPWPGNVRELRNAVARWIAVGDLLPGAPEVPVVTKGPTRDGEGPMVEQAAELIRDLLTSRIPLTGARQILLEHFDRLFLEQRLRESGNHVGKAAAASGIGRRYFQILRARGRG